MRILVIEDNPIHQESARETLLGHETTIVGTVDDAWRLLSERPFPYEAVLTDMLLPVSMYNLAGEQ